MVGLMLSVSASHSEGVSYYSLSYLKRPDFFFLVGQMVIVLVSHSGLPQIRRCFLSNKNNITAVGWSNGERVSFALGPEEVCKVFLPIC